MKDKSRKTSSSILNPFSLFSLRLHTLVSYKSNVCVCVFGCEFILCLLIPLSCVQSVLLWIFFFIWSLIRPTSERTQGNQIILSTAGAEAALITERMNVCFSIVSFYSSLFYFNLQSTSFTFFSLALNLMVDFMPYVAFASEHEA